MDKLTLEHLAPYLPYGLKLWHEGHKATNILEVDIPTGIYNEMSIFTMYSMTIGSKFLKPILRPLSQLHAWSHLLSIGGKGLVGRLNLDAITHFLSYDDISILLKNHFDVFGLIDAGLAIDINTLNTEDCEK